MENIKIWAGEIGDYKLLDSGDGKKLEEIGGVKIVRNEPRAWWKPELSKEEWKTSESFAKNSELFETVIDIGIDGIKAKIKYKKTSKHIGFFPEQVEQWKWIAKKISNIKFQIPNREINVLNLFGYTGIASLVAAKAGLSREASAKWEAKVTHVDASKQSVDWARENQKLSGLEDAPIRWIVDDVVKFIKKEKSRPSFAKASAGEGRKYDAIIMDPPSYGKGPKGEVWKIEEQLPELLKSVKEILSDQPLFIIFNMYSTELSSISVANLLSEITKDLNGNIEPGELAIKTEGSEKLLPMSIFALWQK
ncbi:MAG: class I SAM-dependent methyltransferase [Patescibacteria group bacterium]